MLVINNINNLKLANALVENNIKFKFMLSDSLNEITNVTVEFEGKVEESEINKIIQSISS